MSACRLTRQAEDDLRDISRYISNANPVAAERTVLAIRGRIQSLQIYPLTGHACDELRKGLRSIAVGNYVVFYRYERRNDTVVVLRILHGARDFPGIFGK